MKIQTSDAEFELIEDRVYRALQLSLATARFLGRNNETAFKKYGPKCGAIHFSVVGNFINRSSGLGREFTREMSGKDEDIFADYEVVNFIETYVTGIDAADGGDGRFVLDLHDKVVELLTVNSLSDGAKSWMQAGLRGFRRRMKEYDVLDLR